MENGTQPSESLKSAQSLFSNNRRARSHSFSSRKPSREQVSSIAMVIAILVSSVSVLFVHELGHLLAAYLVGATLTWTGPFSGNIHGTPEQTSIVLSAGDWTWLLVGGVGLIVMALLMNRNNGMNNKSFVLLMFSVLSLGAFCISALFGAWV